MIRKPTLILAWDGDPGHPVATAERLHELIPGSALHVARTPEELRTWQSAPSVSCADDVG